MKSLLLLLVVPAMNLGAAEPGRKVNRNYVLNPAENAAFIDRAADLAANKFYRAPLASLALPDDVREKVLAVLRNSHRKIQRVVLENLWQNAGKDKSADYSGWQPGVKKEYAEQDAALKTILGEDGHTRFLKSMVDAQIARDIPRDAYSAEDLEKARTILRKNLLGSDGLPLADQSAGLDALEGDASSLSAEGRKEFLRRWGGKPFPFSVARPLVSIPGNKSSFDPSFLK